MAADRRNASANLSAEGVFDHGTAACPTRSRLRASITDARRKVVFAPLGDRVRVAGFVEIGAHDNAIPPARTSALLDAAREVLGYSMIDGDIRPWAGQRPATPSGRPIIGRTPIEHLYLNVGHGALGWTLAGGQRATGLRRNGWPHSYNRRQALHVPITHAPRIASSASPVAWQLSGCYERGRLLDHRSAQAKVISMRSGGAAVSCLGHGHPDVLAAMHAQIDRIAYAHTSFFSTEIAEQLADTLIDSAPGDISHAYLVSGGSEAMEAALKLARQYFVEKGEPQRARFIARRNSYHGNTLGAIGGRWQSMAPPAVRAAADRRRSRGADVCVS